MLYVWGGVAVLILNAPGGGASPMLRALIVGGVGFLDWLPKALVVLLLCLGVIWLPIRRSRLGLMFYAIGSDPLAAFRSGVAVGRVKIAA